MEFPTRIVLLCLLLVAPAALGAGPGGETEQVGSTPGADSETAVRIREAWAELHRLQRTGASAELAQRQKAYADEFFEAYLKHPETTPGQQALSTAFRMWGSGGDAEAIEAALARVDPGSRHWGQLIRLARPAFAARERLDDYREIVAGLAGKLTETETAAEVWINLGRDFRAAGDRDRAGDCFRRAMALEAGPSLTDTAKAALRELDRLAVGRRAPRFTAVDLEGRTISLSEAEGKVVLLAFWATRCETCLPEMDRLRRVRAAYPRERLELIGVALDPRADDARGVADARRFDWPQICDGLAVDGPLPRLFEVRDLPRFFLIDGEGRIAARDVSGTDLDAALAELLDTGEPARSRPTAN